MRIYNDGFLYKFVCVNFNIKISKFVVKSLKFLFIVYNLNMIKNSFIKSEQHFYIMQPGRGRMELLKDKFKRNTFDFVLIIRH